METTDRSSTTSENPSMTPEEQRIAIAETCGWRQAERSWINPSGSMYARQTGFRRIQDEEILPDYLNDLNAMHEAEKTLSRWEQVFYQSRLRQIVYDSQETPLNNPDETKFWILHATAAQRAEAFLKVVGKWNHHEKQNE